MTKKEEILARLNSCIVCIDAHTHCGGIDMYNYQHRRLHTTQNMRDLALKMKLARINYFIVSPLPSTTYFNTRDFSITGIDEFPYQLSNEVLLYEARIFGEGALPFLAIHPHERAGKQLAMLEQKVSDTTIFGLKFHPLATHSTIDHLSNSDFPGFLHINRLPIIIHSSDFDEYSDPKLVFRFMDLYPDIRVSIAHCGFFDGELYKRVNNYKNLFIDSSSFNVLCNLFVRRDSKKGKLQLSYENSKKALLELYNLIPDKLMWGTDEPWTCYTDYKGVLVVSGDIFTEKALLDSLPKEVREKISYHNVLRFLGG